MRCRHIRARFVMVFAVGASMFTLGLQASQAQTSGASIRKAAERAAPAVVTVRPLGLVERPLVDLPPVVPGPVRGLIPRRVFRPGAGDLEFAGSGVVIDAERGGVVTCDHVLGGASQAIVILPDGRERVSTAIRRDPETDLALVVIDPRGLNLTAATFAEPPGLLLGDWTVAIGRPAGEAVTLSAGVFAAAREGVNVNRFGALLEADVRVHPVNRGGALVDLEGRLRGVLTDLAPAGVPGQGYAIPVEIVKRVVLDLGNLGYVRRAYLGVQMGTAERGVGEASAPAGVLVQSVANPSPAALAGLRPGDLITAIAGRPVSSPAVLRGLVEFAPIGAPLALSITRGNERLELSVKPQEGQRPVVRPGQAPVGEPDPRGRPRPIERPASVAEPAPASPVQLDDALDPVLVPEVKPAPSRPAPPRPAPPPESR